MAPGTEILEAGEEPGKEAKALARWTMTFNGSASIRAQRSTGVKLENVSSAGET